MTSMSADDATSALRWISTLEATDSGRLMLTNLLFAYRTNRPEQKALRKVVSEVLLRWSEGQGVRADAVIERVADELQHLCFLAPKVQSCGFSRIVDAYSFVLNNISHDRLHFPLYDEVPSALLDVLESGLPADATKGEVRGRRPLAWVTSSVEIDALRQQVSDPGTLANLVRDRLGLSHYQTDQELLELVYPLEVVSTLTCVAPTFLEGGAGLIFRARCCEDGWGRAVDLATMGDGLPEVVHAPVPFSASFLVRRIGRPTRAAGFDFAHVVERAEHPWNDLPSDFKAFLLSGFGADE